GVRAWPNLGPRRAPTPWAAWCRPRARAHTHTARGNDLAVAAIAGRRRRCGDVARAGLFRSRAGVCHPVAVDIDLPAHDAELLAHLGHARLGGLGIDDGRFLRHLDARLVQHARVVADVLGDFHRAELGAAHR